MTTYSYRPYSAGDETEINALYELVTGRRRTKEQWAWQWLAAPAGVGEIWLIEADEGCGKKVIGHHGVMPLRFSLGVDDLLFGKTENTFVHPEYRDKILYPRFESRFRYHYESRFDALFSTTGPSAAIRQRQAQGYESSRRWVDYLWAVNFGRCLRFFSDSVVRRILPRTSTKSARIHALHQLPAKVTVDGVKIEAHSSSGAERSDFFDTFWDSIRTRYPITACRRSADLKWRFWDNPHVEHTTLVLNSETAGTGVAILHASSAGPLIIDDFYVELPSPETYSRLLSAVLKWAGLNGAACVQFATADDSLEWLANGRRPISRYMNVQPYIDRLRKTPPSLMPRKICSSGAAAGLKDHLWYITPAVFEGVDYARSSIE